jgi:hypothetical protein
MTEQSSKGQLIDKLHEFVEIIEDVRWHASVLHNQSIKLRRAATDAENFHFDVDNINQLKAEISAAVHRVESELEMMQDSISLLRNLKPEDQRGVLNSKPRRASSQ